MTLVTINLECFIDKGYFMISISKKQRNWFCISSDTSCSPEQNITNNLESQITLVTLNLEQDSTYLHTYISYLHLLQVHCRLCIGSLVLHSVHFLIVCNTT